MGFFGKSSDNNDDKDKWKNKYLNLLDTQESTEKTYKTEQELLCKTIARLSIAVSGLDPQLDPYLENIRKHIKSGVNSRQLKVDLESLTKALNEVNSSPVDGKAKEMAVALLFDFLLLRYTSNEQQQELNLLRKNYQSFPNHQELFFAIIKIIEDDTSVKVSAVGHIEEIQSFQHQISPSFISSQLLELLQNIEIPEHFTQAAQALKQQLEDHESMLPFESMMDSVVELLIGINANNQPKQQEIDKFLSHITKQLTELGLALSDTGSALIGVSTSRSKLDQSVTEQMSNLQHRSLHATQLEPLKDAISSHIAQITIEIQEQKQKEAEEREKHQHQLEELSQKIRAMESETGELKIKLITANTNAQRDTLTEIPNRKAYDERLLVEIARWQRYHTPLCLVIWDIDYFKKINDQYGHQIGDKVLIHVASELSKNIRRADFVARFGGEEFIMLLPHTKKPAALKVADKLRELLEKSQLTLDNAVLNVTISCGITQFMSGDTHETAFARADKALYRAKELGRNQCCMT